VALDGLQGTNLSDLGSILGSSDAVIVAWLPGSKVEGVADVLFRLAVE